MKSAINTTENARLTIDIPVELHRIIKAHATLENASIKDYVVDALKEKLMKKYMAKKKQMK